MARQFAKTVSLRLEKSVLLIDLDRSRPDLHVYMTPRHEERVDEPVNGGSPVEKSLRRSKRAVFT